MKIRITFFWVLLFGISLFAQPKQLWKSYFSYNSIKDIAPSAQKVIAAAENTLFSKNLSTNEIKTMTSVEDFKAETITALHYSETFKKTLVGNSNGLLIVIDDVTETVLNVIDIVNKPTIPQNIKKINDIYEYNGKVYLACDFGISTFDLSNNQFGDTFFIGPSGQEVKVYQTTVLNNEIYAATQFNGILKADVNNPNLVDFSQWSAFDTGNWNGIETIQNILVASNANNNVYKYNGVGFDPVINVGQPVVDFEVYNDRLVFTSSNHVYVFDQNFMQLAHITQIPENTSEFTCASVINQKLFIGTSMEGLYETNLSNPFVFENISPNGPERNQIFAVKKAPNFLWTVFGDYTQEYNPYPLDEYGISKYSDSEGWTTLPYENLNQAKSLSRIVAHPTNKNVVYVSSFFSGLLKIENQENITLYNQSNTGLNGLESLDVGDPTYIDVRVNGPAFDKNGNLWMTNSRIDRALKVFKADGSWQSYNLANVSISPKDDSYASMVVDRNNTKWIPSFRNGLIAFNENYGNKFIMIKEGSGNGNLPSQDVRCVAVDARNQLWIGTFEGLRIVSSVDRFVQQNSIETSSIIIIDDGVPSELFFQQTIWDIAVDGSNQKWVSVAESGVFLLSSDGQKTIYHFTKENSPLPDNNINDIEIDEVSGEVYFATNKGLVSFKGLATKPSDDLSNVYIYPNPVRPEFNGTVKISGLISDANIKITDIEGNLVYETTSVGGTIEWDTRAFGKHKVASGVYMIFIAGEDGTETKVKKLMIIR